MGAAAARSAVVRVRGASMDEATLKAARSKVVRCCMTVERRVANASDAFKQASFCESASELQNLWARSVFTGDAASPTSLARRPMWSFMDSCFLSAWRLAFLRSTL